MNSAPFRTVRLNYFHIIIRSTAYAMCTREMQKEKKHMMRHANARTKKQNVISRFYNFYEHHKTFFIIIIIVQHRKKNHIPSQIVCSSPLTGMHNVMLQSRAGERERATEKLNAIFNITILYSTSLCFGCIHYYVLSTLLIIRMTLLHVHYPVYAC